MAPVGVHEPVDAAPDVAPSIADREGASLDHRQDGRTTDRRHRVGVSVERGGDDASLAPFVTRLRDDATTCGNEG